MRICRDLKGVIVGWVRLLGGSVTMSKGGFVRVSVKEIKRQGRMRAPGRLQDPKMTIGA